MAFIDEKLKHFSLSKRRAIKATLYDYVGKDKIELLFKEIEVLESEITAIKVILQEKISASQNKKLKKIDKRDKEDTPTREELIELVKSLIPKIIQPKDGKTPTKEELLALIRPLIPIPEKGLDGHTPTDEELLELIKPLIPEPLRGSPDSLYDIRNKLELLEGKERLKIEAIHDLREELDNLKEIRASGGGGTNLYGVRNAIRLLLHTEQPIGAINGVNTTYTVENEIWTIISFTLNNAVIAELPNYTYNGRIITFSSPLPTDFSGRDFEVKYIG